MVAITVILAAVIAAFVFGLAGTTSTAKNVAVTAKFNPGLDASDAKVNGIELTYQGGADNAKLNYLMIRVTNTPATGAATTIIVYSDISGTITGALLSDAAPDPESDGQPSVGQKYQITDTVAIGTQTPVISGAGTNSVTVTGKFIDGSEQVLLDTRV